MHLARLAPLLAASSVPASIARDADPGLSGHQGQPCVLGCCSPLECADDGTCRAAADSCPDTVVSVGPWRVDWGDLRGHTDDSDGQGSLRRHFTSSRDTARLDFVSVTDHVCSNQARWRVPQVLWTNATAKIVGMSQSSSG